MSETKSAIDRLISGAIDMHVHFSPDSLLPRRQDAWQLAQSARDMGMRGIVLKNRDYDTVPVAVLVNKLVPEVSLFGSLTMDYPVGGINPAAVLSAARLGAKVIWMPTFTAANSRKRTERTFGFKLPEPGQTVLDSGGKLRPEVKEILKTIKDHDIVLATGHLAPQEVFVLVGEAMSMGLTKVVVTHALQGQVMDTSLSVEEIKQLAKSGAYIEHCVWAYMPTQYRADPKPMVEVVKSVGADRCFMSTDLGQDYNPTAPEGMRLFIALMLRNGLEEKEIEMMVKTNPARLLGLD